MSKEQASTEKECSYVRLHHDDNKQEERKKNKKVISHPQLLVAAPCQTSYIILIMIISMNILWIHNAVSSCIYTYKGWQGQKSVDLDDTQLKQPQINHPSSWD